MGKLAVNGGEKVRKELFPAYRYIGVEEEKAVVEVIRSGVLSKFIGGWHKDFYGGPQVQALEKEWASYVGAKHAIAVNSATAGLYAAVGAAGVSPGDEVIVSPYTMSASATAAVVYGAVPVFADIEEDYYCIDADSVEERITERTRAIVVVDIFGLPYDVERINAIAKKHNLIIIEDAAQAPGARYKGKSAGTLGDMGVYSLNYHKHIHCGEGGIVVTDDDLLADKLRLIRNHAESVVEGMGFSDLVNMVGFNYRMTEIEAAIAREQLKKLDSLTDERIRNIGYITEKLSQIPCLKPAKVREHCRHVFYKHAITFDMEKAGVSREKFLEAVKAELTPIELREDEGINISGGYVKPIYLMPMYQKLTAFGKQGYPFKSPYYSGKADYSKGICPVCEKMHFEALISHEYIRPPMTRDDLDDFVKAFEKVWENRGELK